MLGLIERTRDAFREFIDQRDDLMAIVPCRESDSAVVLKIFRDLEDVSDSDVLLFFADDFFAPGPYISVLVERLAEQHRVANDYAAEQQRPPLPPMPDELFDTQRRPEDRLFDAVRFAKSLIPAGGGHRLVWVMCPATIADRPAWLSLAAMLAPEGHIAPWMSGLRVVVRDEVETEAFAPEMAAGARVRVIPVDFGTNALAQGLHEDAEDETLPLEQRMQALLSLAIMEGGHGKLTEAASKLEILLGHYQETGNVQMQAFVINAFGDICRAAGDHEKARHWYECAATPAADAKDAGTLAMVTKNLGEVAYHDGRFLEAAEYFAGLDQLAAHMLQPETKVYALEWRGLSLEQAGDDEGAEESWESAVTLCRSIGLPALLVRNLEHLERLYARTRRSRVHEIRDELDAARQEVE